MILHERYLPRCQYLDPFEWLSPKAEWMFMQDGVILMLCGMILLTGLIYACILERGISRG